MSIIAMFLEMDIRFSKGYTSYEDLVLDRIILLGPSSDLLQCTGIY
jgi:hypothetical protein